MIGTMVASIRSTILQTRSQRQIAEIQHRDTEFSNQNVLIRNLTEQITSFSTQVTNLTAQCAQVNAQLDSERTARRTLQKEIEVLEAAAKERDATITALRAELAEKQQYYEERIQAMHGENRLLKQKNEDLQKRLENAEKRLGKIEAWTPEDISG